VEEGIAGDERATPTSLDQKGNMVGGVPRGLDRPDFQAADCRCRVVAEDVVHRTSTIAVVVRIDTRPASSLETNRRLVAGDDHRRCHPPSIDGEAELIAQPPRFTRVIGMAVGQEEVPDRGRVYAIGGEDRVRVIWRSSSPGIEEHPLTVAAVDQKGVAVENIGQIEAAAAAHDHVQA
jgi:hypothetical protein